MNVGLFVSRIAAHIDWLRQQHKQTSGAARSLRDGLGNITDSFVAEQKRKAADSASIKAAHFHELAEGLDAVVRARGVLQQEISAVAASPALAFHERDAGYRRAFERYVFAVDKALGVGRVDEPTVAPMRQHSNSGR